MLASPHVRYVIPIPPPGTFLDEKIDLQGTWQFMAADLVENPNIDQTFIHDIESTFFVLLWMSILYIKSNWDRNRRSSFVSSIFHPRLFGSSGGSTKIMFMCSEQPDILDLHNNTPLTQLLRDLKELLAIRHKKRPEKAPHGHRLDIKDMIQQALHRQETESASTPVGTDASPRDEEEFQARVADYETRMAALKNHDIVIFAITRAIEDKHTLWPAIEPAEKQDFFLSRVENWSLRLSSKRCREAAVECEGGDLMERRKRNKVL